jgi:hypothetical protein
MDRDARDTVEEAFVPLQTRERACQEQARSIAPMRRRGGGARAENGLKGLFYAGSGSVWSRVTTCAALPTTHNA